MPAVNEMHRRKSGNDDRLCDCVYAPLTHPSHTPFVDESHADPPLAISWQSRDRALTQASPRVSAAGFRAHTWVMRGITARTVSSAARRCISLSV